MSVTKIPSVEARGSVGAPTLNIRNDPPPIDRRKLFRYAMAVDRILEHA